MKTLFLDVGDEQGNVKFDIGDQFPDITDTNTTDVYVGKFEIAGAGTKTVSGMPFEPDMVEFMGLVPIGSYNEDAGPDTDNSDTWDNTGGSMFGYARDDNGSISQQVMTNGIAGDSINSIRQYASDSNCIAAQAADESANLVGEVIASLSSFDSNGFTINCGTYNLDSTQNGLIVLYRAYKRS